MNFYRAFLEEGVRPTDNAIAALHYASNLARRTSGFSMNSAVAYLNERNSRKRDRLWCPSLIHRTPAGLPKRRAR